MDDNEKLRLKQDYLSVADIYLSLGKTNMAKIMQSTANNIVK